MGYFVRIVMKIVTEEVMKKQLADWKVHKETEDRFIEQYGGYRFFDGGDAEAQYVYRRLEKDGWIDENSR